MNTIFSADYKTNKPHIIIEGKKIENPQAIISANVSEEVLIAGEKFSSQIDKNFVADFEKTQLDFDANRVDVVDKMVHVSTFMVINNVIYTTYYANVHEASEDPTSQIARLVYCPVNDTENKTFIDIQAVGDTCCGLPVNLVYDTIMAKTGENVITVLWTAKVGDNYYRLYRNFDILTKTLGEVGVNRFKVGEITNDFSTTGIQGALAENGIGYKRMFSDIGIMQKFTSRNENGKTYYYTGTYSGDFTAIIKSTDFITWEYVSQPDFLNESKWENATYVLGDKVYYFVRQQDDVKYGFLTTYNLVENCWENPVIIEDCQSRGDFILYNNELYLFHAPIDREHIGVVKIDTNDISKSKAVIQAKISTSCFYPFIQYFEDGELAMSYTVERKHIRLAKFNLKNCLQK